VWEDAFQEFLPLCAAGTEAAARQGKNSPKSAAHLLYIAN